MLHIICNPKAGNGRAKSICEKVIDTLKAEHLSYELDWTDCPGHATQLASEAAQRGVETVLSIGGDGTAYEVACGLKGTQTALGIIPAGTGNDFIKTLGYPLDPIEALEHILTHPALETDVGNLGERMFLNETGTGFDVTALFYANKVKKYCRGMLPYLIGVICAIFKYRPLDLTYQIENQPPVHLDAMICGVANGGIIGGGIKIAPDAQVDDGLFDIVIIRYIPRWRILPYLFKLLAGKVLTFPETIFCRASRITFSAPDMLLNIDGEIKKMEKAELSVAAGELLIHR